MPALEFAKANIETYYGRSYVQELLYTFTKSWSDNILSETALGQIDLAAGQASGGMEFAKATTKMFTQPHSGHV